MAVETDVLTGPPGGNALPDLNKHPAHNEPPVPINRPRTEPSRAMSASPQQKYLLPAGPELRDIIRRRLEAKPMSTPALWASLNQSYQTRPRQEQAVIDAVAGMLADAELEQRDGKLHVAVSEPAVAETPESIDPALWTMTHTQRVLHVLGTEPMTREALARATGLKPRQVSKAAYLLIQQGHVEVVGDVPRTWRRTQPMSPRELWAAMNQDAEPEPETAVLTEEQTRAVVLERVGRAYAMTEPVIADVMRLSGWDEGGVAMLIDTLAAAGDLDIHADGSISRAAVKSEEPPEYVVGDEDDGEIPEPGVARLQTDPVFAPWVVFDGVVGLDADSEQEARRVAEGRAYGGHESAVYQRVAVCRPRPEWVDGQG